MFVDPFTAMAISATVMAGTSMFSAFSSSKAQKKANKIAAQQLALQTKEIQRQREQEVSRQKRENEQLMNSVSNLTNTSYSGVSSPTVDYDKYGDLG